DITHGCRSLPMVVLMAVCFLRVARRVEVERILYGAYEARDESASPPRVPMFDLTQMFDLLEWAVAADRFVRLGDARDLATLLRKANPPGPMQRLDPALRDLGRRLGPLAKRLDAMSLSLLLARTYDVMRTAEELGSRLERAEEVYPPEARPFAEISAQVEDAFRDLALAEPQAPQNVVGSLDRQRRLIHWYWEHQHYMQTATLAR
ncbi:MAG: TM1812 family CRISPR-associated protein, partial [Chloroflexi bacterium]|nr:TM1812 family CRISPR-associated protein [Chloroflexota bacterium]